MPLFFQANDFIEKILVWDDCDPVMLIVNMTKLFMKG